jgi:Carboxypeptidase regulatory-like domain/TonB-dependent Receptor Plug Domain
MKKFGGSILAAMLAMVILLTSAHAQTSTGTIVGTVVDKSGAAVPNATVKASSAEFGKDLRTTTTDSAGGYRLESLLPGIYTVTVEASGFNKVDMSKVQVKGSLLVTANVTLDVSGLSSTVLVEASAGQELQTESGSLGAEISTQEITNIPVLTLNPIELVVTHPGVQDNTNQMGFSNGVNFSVNGTRPRANNFLIDGQDNNDNSISGQAFQTTNLQAVQEITILTNAYAAEYGRGGGSVTNEISKTGTNTFHGDAWELNRNNSFAAVDAKNGLVGVTRNPRDNENTFGFDFGGPVKGNKLFFYGTLQDDREYQAAQGQTLNIPTAAGIATLQGLLPNPNVQLLLNSLAGLVAPSTGSGVFNVPLGAGPNGVDRGSVQENIFQRSGIPEIQTTREWRVRADWNATPFDTLNASYRRSDFNLNLDFFNNPSSLPPFDTNQSGPAQAFTGNWNHTFSPRAVNEFRFSYSNISFTFGPTAAAASGPLANTPGINFNGTSGLPSLGIITGLPQFRGHKSYQFQEALSYTVGRHSFKMGADIDYLQVDDLVPFNSRGTINLFDNKADPTTNTAAFSDLANFIDNFTGQGGAVAINFGNPEVQPFVGIYAPYIQDTWHVRPNFTLDLGLRYEYWGTVGNAAQFPSIPFGFGVPGATLLNIASAKQQGDKNNFAPRIGFAYTPHILPRFFGNNKTVIRAGYGIFYDGIFTNILDNTVANSPNATGATFTAGTKAGSGRGLANATGLLASATPVANPQTTIESMATKIRNPLTHQWNLDIQRELPGGFVFTAAYVGTRGEHLFVNQELNPGINQFDAANNLIRVNPNFGSVVVRNNGGDSIYHSGQFSVDRKFSHGLLLRAAYTYSKLIDDGSEVFTSTGGSTFSEIINRQSSDRGLSAYDRRNRFVATYVWDLPSLRHSDNMAMSVVGYITRGWSWSGTFTAQTGNPETISSGLDFNGDGHGGNDRPNLGNPAAPFTSVGIDGSQLGAATGTIFGPYQDCLNGLPTCVAQPASTFHFIIPAVGVQGNLGRNTFIGPGQWFYNTGVARTFKLHERHQLTFRTEFFNAFNHPNFFTDAPGVLTGGGSNIIFDAAGANFGKFAQTIAGGRQIKFWLKYSF